MELNNVLGQYGNPSKIRERLHKHIQKTENHWFWRGHTHRDDGQFWLRAKEVKPLPLQTYPHGKNISARRLVYLLAYGEIPLGKNVRVSCGTPACLNPEHLVIEEYVPKMRTRAPKTTEEIAVRVFSAKPYED